MNATIAQTIARIKVHQRHAARLLDRADTARAIARQLTSKAHQELALADALLTQADTTERQPTPSARIQ